MEKTRLGGHYLEKYDEELEAIRNRVLSMGGLVEEQISHAITALGSGDVGLAEEVVQNDMKVNGFEVGIDEQCSQVLARHQPAASDLRFVIAVIKTITDLERIGDQAERVARMALQLARKDRPKNQYADVVSLGERVLAMVHGALDAFARMDVEAAVQVARSDVAVDNDYESIMRQSITFMMEDPRTISRAMDVIWAIRALERIGDHARNMCEYVVYLVKGKDVRHISLDQLEEAALGKKPG
ncbi:phosphate transport system regulatory protein PhoU [Thioalkalivibrio denitrificans]|uniref:Phosphate-specific transport system accessory protein PhoU n=1 Tax=Thioalkalivibrio denitrificans TaxID=108003 RepID=A0A1V3NG45_9GAMM|nr:phosphate signaling complex protein PhoU [Thioalkalivibrio denitrificans]OOG24051.1 phosphate transport system regulatory protein PhoU [Thioalkalivibrio denitrificans]